MSEQEKQAALAFAHSRPHDWDAFYAEWLKEHPEEIRDGDVSWIPTEPVDVEEGGKKRKVKKPEP